MGKAKEKIRTNDKRQTTGITTVTSEVVVSFHL